MIAYYWWTKLKDMHINPRDHDAVLVSHGHTVFFICGGPWIKMVSQQSHTRLMYYTIIMAICKLGDK